MGHDDRERKFEKALERHLRQGAASDATTAANFQAEPPSPACPDAAMLAAFHERMLSNEEMDAAKAHIAACSRCQEILAHLEATDEVVPDVADVVADVEQEKVLELREPVLAGSAVQEEEYSAHAATPVVAARPTGMSKTPQSISSGRRAKMWRWVAPAAAVAAGLLIWMTSRDTLHRSSSPANNIEVAQEKPAERQFNDRLVPLPPGSLPAQTRENGRLDESLKSLTETKRPADALGARSAPRRAVGGTVGGVVGAPSGAMNRESRREPRIDVFSEVAPAKPVGNAASQGDVSVTGASPLVPADTAELDKATAKGRKKSDSPTMPGNAPSSSGGGNAAGVAGGQNARDSGREILEEQKLEPGVSAELSASSAARPQPAAPPPAAARAPAKQSAGSVQKKEAGANAVTATTAQAEVTADYERTSSLQNDKAGHAKISDAKTSGAKNKDASLILTPGGTVLWRLRATGKIERSADRGITWSQQNSGVKLELLAGSAPSDAVCWLVGRAGIILRTTDGGGHWSTVVSPVAGDLGGIRAEDALHATIVGAGSDSRFTTSDGGATWTPAKE